jgi:ribose 5-phosphate isomerase B
MKIAIAADHAGYTCKDQVGRILRELGHEVLDLGTHSNVAVDYPDYGFAVGEAVSSGKVERGIVVCGSSIGITIAANKVPGVRCAPVFEPLSTELARRHNNVNVIAVSERLSGWEMTERLIQIFLETPFDGGRHAERVGKLGEYTAQTREKAQADVARGEVQGAETPTALLPS